MKRLYFWTILWGVGISACVAGAGGVGGMIAGTFGASLAMVAAGVILAIGTMVAITFAERRQIL